MPPVAHGAMPSMSRPWVARAAERAAEMTQRQPQQGDRGGQVVGEGGGPVPPGVEDVGGQLAGEVQATAVQPGDRDQDLRGTYARWFGERGLRAVVVRPDYYVFGWLTQAQASAPPGRKSPITWDGR